MMKSIPNTLKPAIGRSKTRFLGFYLTLALGVLAELAPQRPLAQLLQVALAGRIGVEDTVSPHGCRTTLASLSISA